jgi:1,6-anhydro-N-acetylmuramate kinase
MIIPVPNLWKGKPEIRQQDQIDRAVSNRNYRLIAGLSIDRSFEQVTGVLFISGGHGKFIRCRHTVETSIPISAVLRKSCLRFFEGQDNDQGTFHSLLSDLASIQAAVVERLKIEAGKFVDRILAVSVSDPGLWRKDFDGRISYSSFCDATRLAELCGISVIDNFPAADIAAGGNGSPLDALPFWLLAADRNPRVARQERFVLQVNEQTTLLRLPVSDGLDSELPEFELWQLQDCSFIRCTSESHFRPSTSTVPDPETILAALDPVIRGAIGQSDNDHHVELICVDAKAPPANLASRLTTAYPILSVIDVANLGCPATSVAAALTAILGLMHIDQLPSNVPWLTGANAQRILGRLTLGRPSNWRQLVRVMADYQPAAMKLKDAV